MKELQALGALFFYLYIPENLLKLSNHEKNSHRIGNSPGKLWHLGTLAANYHIVVPIAASASTPNESQATVAVSLISSQLPQGFVDVEYAGYDFKQLLTVSGDPGYNAGGATFQAFGLPEGMSLTSSGILSGKPKATTEGASFNVIATYKAKAGKQVYTVVVKDKKFDVTAITTGRQHTCALTTQGGVKCWGYNYYGQLGTGTLEDKHYPVDVVGLDKGVASISAGDYHTCAVMRSGGVKCWGAGGVGELGNGQQSDSATPTDVVGLSSGVVNVSSGGGHTCAVTTTGAAQCWGDGYEGQLGNNLYSASASPVAVTGLASSVVSIHAGQYHTCAVTTAGSAMCWGAGGMGELGNGHWDNSAIPVEVSGLSAGVSNIAAGYGFTCALTSVGGVKCWGFGGQGNLGNNAGIDSNVPVDVQDLVSGVSSIASGHDHSCAVATTGALKCWGANSSGQLGDNSDESRMVPVDVVGLSSGVKSVDGGMSHTCAVLEGGGSSCWGSGSHGQLGNESTADSWIPLGVNPHHTPSVKIFLKDTPTFPSLTLNKAMQSIDFRDVYLDIQYGGTSLVGDAAAEKKVGTGFTATGLPQGLSLSADGILSGTPVAKTSGIDFEVVATNGESTNTRNYSVKIYEQLRNIKDIFAGYGHTCALTNAGGVKCWGVNAWGALGNATNTDSLTPVDVVGLSSGVTAIAVGMNHTCALMATGTVKCWGESVAEQPFSYILESSNVPVDISNVSSAVRVVAGDYHTCMLISDGTVKCFGDNSKGQLGRESMGLDYFAYDVPDLSGVVELTAGRNHTCALLGSGELKCWGANGSSQLGNGDYYDSRAPVTVTDGIRSVEAGGAHTCAVTTSGSVKCWGSTGSALPEEINGLTGVQKIQAGGDHTCALMESGGLTCWGSAYTGQLGIGDTSDNNSDFKYAIGLTAGVKSVSAGDEYTCAVMTNGEAKCWGAGWGGQTGRDSTENSDTPGDVYLAN